MSYYNSEGLQRDPWDDPPVWKDKAAILVIGLALAALLILGLLYGDSKVTQECSGLVSGVDVSTGKVVTVQVADDRLC